MKTADGIATVAPCGIHCGSCPPYLAKDNPKLTEYLISKGFKKESLPCLGCRTNKGNCPLLGCTCETYACVTEHRIDFCFECPDFPCSKLNPAADKADVLPHNLKVFNLCCIKHQGLDKWLEKESDIKQRYYQGKMAIGKGPQLE